MTHSTEIREKALEYLERCKNIRQVARVYGIYRSILYCWLDLNQKISKVDRRVAKARPREIDQKGLAAYIEQYPDAYLAEIAKHFHCSVVAVFYALRSMRITRKKGHNVYGTGACKSGRLSVTAATYW